MTTLDNVNTMLELINKFVTSIANEVKEPTILPGESKCIELNTLELKNDKQIAISVTLSIPITDKN